jgi:cytochrome c-type biogenesis protein CcmH
MVTRYGDFVLYRPPVKGVTLLLWGGPVALLLIGLFLLVSYLRRRAHRLADTDQPLAPEDAQRAEALLKELESK